MTLLLRYQRCWELTKLAAREKVFNVNNMLFSPSVIHGQFQEERETGKAYHKWGNASQVVTLRDSGSGSELCDTFATWQG